MTSLSHREHEALTPEVNPPFEGDREHRCPHHAGRCLQGDKHSGAHVPDDGSEHHANFRRHWELKARAAIVALMHAIEPKRGRPKKMSQGETISSIAKRLGYDRSTLHRWRDEEGGKTAQKTLRLVKEPAFTLWDNTSGRIRKTANKLAGNLPAFPSPEEAAESVKLWRSRIEDAFKTIDAALERMGLGELPA